MPIRQKVEVIEPRTAPGRARFWNRSMVIGLARGTCAHCNGTGWIERERQSSGPCNCAFREIFRVCYRRYRQLRVNAGFSGKVDFAYCATGRDGKRYYSLKQAEYMADFEIVARRELNAQLWGVFDFHFLHGWDWNFCTRRLGMDRGTFFHAVYRVEQRLGRIYGELRPYALYPVRDYFNEVRVSVEPMRRRASVTAHIRQICSDRLPACEGPRQFAAAGGM